MVSLSAKALKGSTFLGWKQEFFTCTGCDSCAVSVDKAKAIKAVFMRDYKLKDINRSKKGGTGVVSSTLSCINCSTGNSTGCAASYRYGTVVILFASADAGSSFLGWSFVKLRPGIGDCIASMDKKHIVKTVLLGQQGQSICLD